MITCRFCILPRDPNLQTKPRAGRLRSRGALDSRDPTEFVRPINGIPFWTANTGIAIDFVGAMSPTAPGQVTMGGHGATRAVG
jgi:hypothetical protein